MNLRQKLYFIVLALLAVVGLWAAASMMRDPGNIPHSATEKPVTQ